MKKFLCGFLSAILLMGLIIPAMAITGRQSIEVDPINIMVNGRTFVPKDANGAEVPVFAYNGTTYAPLRALAEAYGLEVGYDAASNMATVSKPGSTATPAPAPAPAVDELGDVTGMISYKYNNYIGNRGDTGATVILISKSVTSLPDSLALGLTFDLPKGVYATKADGSGNYTFSNVPAGDYYIVVISKNTNENPSYVSASLSWGGAYFLFSEKGKENALINARVNKTRSSSITVYANRSTNYSHDFGTTYF